MRRVAVLGDVHGNAVALHAVLAEVARQDLDGIVWTGDLSWAIPLATSGCGRPVSCL
jgi:Calcineurin-like phosphoesterase